MSTTGWKPSAPPGAETREHKTSSNFIGVNEKGWIFRCAGEKGVPHITHAFIAQPPTTG